MGDIEKLQEAVTEQAVTTAVLVKAVSSIESLMSEQTASIKEIMHAMKNQELLMEKYSNMDARVTDSVNRIHKRIDKLEAEQDTMKIEHKNTCDLVKPMAHKGAVVHGIMVKAAIGLAVAVSTVLGSVILWAIRQGAK